MTGSSPSLDLRGVTFAVCCYLCWGLLPLYFHLLSSVGPMQVLSHRVVWSFALLIVLVVALRKWRGMWQAAQGRTLLLLMASALLIGVNWLVYIWAVQNGHVLEASLGYFINPLMNVAFGVFLLGERLRKMQGVAIGIAAAGVAALALSGGGSIWVSLVLAGSFSVYGLIRKVAAIDALGGLTVETILLAPVAMLWLLYTGSQGASGFGQSVSIDLLLIASGVITATPLLLFSAAARRMNYSTLGLIQYLSPTMQLCIAVALGEQLLPMHFITFALIWTGCGIYTWDAIRASRKMRIVPG